MTLELPCVDMTTLVRAFSAQIEMIAQKLGIHVRVSVDEGVFVGAHSEALQRALLSLLVTTTRYTSDQCTVEVTLEKNKTQARLVLEAPLTVDNEIITTPRRPLDHLESLLEGGLIQLDSGFGTIEAILAEYGGRLEVLQADGNISGFVVRLPRLDPPEESTGASGTQTIQERSKTSAPDEESRQEVDIPCVLVLISNADIADFIVGALSARYRVLQAADHLTAIQQIELENPDLVITERFFEARCATFKNCHMLASTPVINLITSEDDISEPYDDAPTMEAFLRMPFTEGIVRRRVARLIRFQRSSTRQLRESEERYRLLFRHSPEAIVVSENEQVILVNRAALRLFRADNEEQLLGKSIYEIVDSHYHGALRQRVQYALQTQEPLPLFENRMLRLDGRPIDVETLSVPINLGG